MNRKRGEQNKRQNGKVVELRKRESQKTTVEDSVRQILAYIGEDPNREGLVKTPYRVARAYEYLTKGYDQDPKEVINKAMFTEDYQEMVLVKDIDFFSLCEHHLLPFFGRAHVAYIPKHRIVGLSKVARLVEVFSRRLQVQERLTTQVANTIMEELDPLGVGVVIRAEHLCMRMRGVEKQNSIVTTSAMLGAFRTQQPTREEFITLVNGGR
jgi:GTP cyclohydrolase I